MSISKSVSRILRSITFATLLTLPLIHSGCAKSADELLIGRWYSGDMTIRFREDSAVIWNSPNGLALGRYEFTGKRKHIRSDELQPNLFLDVVRNDERRQFRFEITFIADDRIQLELVPANLPSSDAPVQRSGFVLKRAVEDGTLGGAVQRVAQK